MGKTTTPPYRLVWTERTTNGTTEQHTIGWDTKATQRGQGKATKENAIRYLRHYESSTKEGGVNAQIGERKVISFSLINQKTGNPVASGNMTLTFTEI